MQFVLNESYGERQASEIRVICIFFFQIRDQFPIQGTTNSIAQYLFEYGIILDFCFHLHIPYQDLCKACNLHVESLKLTKITNLPKENSQDFFFLF